MAPARRKDGLRCTMGVVPLAPSRVRESHCGIPESPLDGPVLLCSDPAAPGWAEARNGLRATDVRPLVEQLLRVPQKYRAVGFQFLTKPTARFCMRAGGHPPRTQGESRWTSTS
ncbi:hypothetical protein GCM10010185_54620 [Saccharothrix coeruleofusca]|uniref:Uncharacterized protein n=1 Tax=Saccharothrix coeruleofusca TaxID=33919 RepID=A0A918ARU0_9PSEU|nr:hypothetical protein GCM10010185_54620 [Saccharothrix coeruleofusca]